MQLFFVALAAVAFADPDPSCIGGNCLLGSTIISPAIGLKGGLGVGVGTLGLKGIAPLGLGRVGIAPLGLNGISINHIGIGGIGIGHAGLGLRLRKW